MSEEAMAGAASALTVELERDVDAFIAFADKTTYLHHPDVPYHGTEKGDSEELWRRRVVAAALAPIIAAEREACAKVCEELRAKWINEEAGDPDHTVSDFLACAKAIRERSNLEFRGAEPTGGASPGTKS